MLFNPDVFASALTAMIPAAGGIIVYQYKNHRDNQRTMNELIAKLKFWSDEFPPHLHVKGRIVYPKGMQNGKEDHI